MGPLLLWLLGLLLAPADLGSAHWHVRDAAEGRLKAAGPLAVPLLRPLATADDPEVRRAAGRLLTRPDALIGDLEAAALWLSDARRLDGISCTEAVSALYADPRARFRLASAFARLKLLDADDAQQLADGATPDVVRLWLGKPPYATVYALVRRAQQRWAHEDTNDEPDHR